MYSFLIEKKENVLPRDTEIVTMNWSQEDVEDCYKVVLEDGGCYKERRKTAFCPTSLKV